MRIFKMFKKYPVSDFYFVADTKGESSIMLVDEDLEAYDIFSHKETNYFQFYKKSVLDYCEFSNSKLTISQVKKESMEGFKKFKDYVEFEEEARSSKSFVLNLKDKVEHETDNGSKYGENVIFIEEDGYDIK